MVINLILGALVIILLILLMKSNQIKSRIAKEKNDLIALREAALDISNKVLHVESSENQFQYILEACMLLVPKANYGSILMFNHNELLIAKASVGFEEEEISSFELPLEESFLYIASNGKVDQTMIINRLEDIILEKNVVSSFSEDQEFALRSEVAAPLFMDDTLVGMLCLDGDVNDIFTDKDIHILDYMSRQISNVIGKQELYNEVLFLSQHDGLTGLLNRDYFDKNVKNKIGNAKSNNMELHFIIIDLNGLKTVNDTFGHAIGDQLIKVFSMEFEKVISKYGICARYGGDEFVGYIENLKFEDVIAMMKLLKKLLKKRRIQVENSFIYPKFSYGISNMTESEYTFDMAYKIADKRMYDYKTLQRKLLNSHLVS